MPNLDKLLKVSKSFLATSQNTKKKKAVKILRTNHIVKRRLHQLRELSINSRVDKTPRHSVKAILRARQTEKNYKNE